MVVMVVVVVSQDLAATGIKPAGPGERGFK